MKSRGEFEMIEDFAAAIPRRGDGVIVGVGDDCAVVRSSETHDLLLTTDLLLEGRHFRSDAAPVDIGWKALAVSLSDIAAMGGRPRHALLSLALRDEHSGEFADALLKGLLECAARFGCALVGGDTNGTDGALVVSVTVTGDVPRGAAVLRSGAHPGDAILVTGALGGSIRGRHLRVHPRVSESQALVAGGRVHAMIDVSDGLSSDLGHIADASGVSAEVWADRVPVHADATELGREDGRDPLDHALNDGEDFELCFTVSEERAARLVTGGFGGTPVARIGRIGRGRGVVLLDREGATSSARPLVPGGFDHFRRD